MMLAPYRRAALALFVAVAPTPAAAAPAPGSATDAIQVAHEKVRGLLQAEATAPDKAAHASAITQALRDLFDIGLLAERALTDHWAKMTAAQRSALVTTLQSIIEKNYVSQLRGNLAYEVEYAGEETAGDDVLVHTVIHAKRNGRPANIPVDYRLHKGAAGWRIYDVLTEGVSILQNYRSQFSRIIAKEGVDGLITRMKAKLDAPKK
ncbi:MAG TPA: ABC transporter substrate-binding protein [Myxococcota bacterium]|nr:ABC transporter substrate-binding protein [Myxococcota bacterium]